MHSGVRRSSRNSHKISLSALINSDKSASSDEEPDASPAAGQHDLYFGRMTRLGQRHGQTFIANSHPENSLLPPPGQDASSLASQFDIFHFSSSYDIFCIFQFRCFCGFCFRALSLHPQRFYDIFHCERCRRGTGASILRCFAEQRCQCSSRLAGCSRQRIKQSQFPQKNSGQDSLCLIPPEKLPSFRRHSSDCL